MTPEQKLAAKRFNKFLERVSAAFLNIGMAIGGASVISLTSHNPVIGSWVWCGVGVVLIGSSTLTPYLTEPEE